MSSTCLALPHATLPWRPFSFYTPETPCQSPIPAALQRTATILVMQEEHALVTAPACITP